MPVNINIVAQDLPIMHNIHTINRVYSLRTPPPCIADTARFDAKRSQGLRDHNFWHHLVPSSTTYENRVGPNVLLNAQKHSYIVV